MASLVLAARVVLAVIFATAGVAKLLDRPGSQRALAAFGVAPRLLSPAALLLPLTEIAVACALLFASSARWGALAGVALLLAFVGGIARALSQGQAPDCHCFGQLHSAPAGRATLARNAAFAVLAGIVAWQGPGPALDAWVADRTAAELVAVVAGAAAIVAAGFATHLWLDRRGLRAELASARGELAGLPPGLPVGASAPSFALPDLDGNTVTLASLCAGGQSVILLFVSPQCGPCWMMLPSFARWQATLTGRMTLALVSNGTAQDNRQLADKHGISNVLIQEKTEVMKAFRVRATPTAVAVSPDGRISSTTVEGGRPIEPLIRLTLQRGASRRSPAGTPAADPSS